MAKKIEERYKKLTQIEHVLKRPGMYVGSLENEVKKLFVVDDILSEKINISEKLTKFNPGFLKLFDEILVNASDHFVRTDGKVKYIKVWVHSDRIIVENDGPGIPVQMHKEHKIYVPELIFGNLLSGENFEDEDRVVGGLHGLGAKCVNIYSKKFILDTGDGKKRYTQEFHDNLTKIDKPKIKLHKKNFTRIEYYPDFEKFGIGEISPEFEKILYKRCVDIAIYCPKVKVYYNDDIIPITTFKDYMSMYSDKDSEMFYEKINDNWEIGITQSSDDNFQQVSMVNGICTHIGGTHVNFITKKIVDGIKETLEKKHKKITIRPNDIKNKLFLFLNCKIVNPSFDSQTKENLTTRLIQKHTNGVDISPKLLKQICSSEIVEDILDYIKLREKAELSKLNKGKTSKVKIKKLDDANRAGTNDSEKCHLALTEGDSAKSFCISGFASTGRDYWGVFPLKGKPLNIRDVTLEKIKNNEEIKHIIEALGLEFGKKYTSTKDLRYGKLILITDADCLHENTKIRTKRGNIMIKDIRYDDKVLTHTGQYKSILNIIKTSKKEYIEIKSNGIILKLGKYHKLFVYRNKEIIQLFAKDILNDDKLLVKK